MAHVMPQVALHRLIQEGIASLKSSPEILDKIFTYYKCEEMEAVYGQPYIDKIKKWFTETKIPVVQAWSLNPSQVPQISIKLATEQEDESKAAIGDHWGMGEDANIGVSPFVVQLDIGIHASRNGDEVLWLYYIVNYILFKRKRRAEALGMQLYTFSATDYSRENARLPDNMFTRYIRLRTIVQNFWDAEDYMDIDDMDVSVDGEGA